MSDLSRYVEMYRMTTEHDTEVLWKKVEIIRTAIADGADVETLLSECGKESGDSRKQVRKFYAVARVFDAEDAAPDHDYWIYEVAATAPGVEIESAITYEIAYDWIHKALKGREIKRGKKTIYAKHTARTLRAAIRAATAGAKPSKAETVVRNMECRVTYIDNYESDPWTKLMVASNTDLAALKVGDCIHITITRQPQAVNAEVAA